MHELYYEEMFSTHSSDEKYMSFILSSSF